MHIRGFELVFTNYPDPSVKYDAEADPGFPDILLPYGKKRHV